MEAALWAELDDDDDDDNEDNASSKRDSNAEEPVESGEVVSSASHGGGFNAEGRKGLHTSDLQMPDLTTLGLAASPNSTTAGQV